MSKSILISLMFSFILFPNSSFAMDSERISTAPPLVCDIRTQFLCIAAGNSAISLSELRGQRIWSVVDADTGSIFRVSEDKACSAFIKEGLIVRATSYKKENKSRFWHDTYRLDGASKCSVDVSYERRIGIKPSYSEVLSSSQVLFCRGWRDYDCKQRFDLTSARP